MKKLCFIGVLLSSLLLYGCGDTGISEEMNPEDGSAGTGTETDSGDETGSDSGSGNESGSGSGSSSGGENASDEAALAVGKVQYDLLCASCHGDEGQGGLAGGELLACASCSSVDTLTSVIHDTMPVANTGECVDDCAENVARYIFNKFSTELSPISAPTPTAAPGVTPTSAPMVTPTPRVTPTPPNMSPVPGSLDLVAGKQAYDAQCVSCHGVEGVGGSGGDLVGCVSCGSFETLSRVIHETMPYANTTQCTDDCADNVAGYILNNFSTSSEPKPDVQKTQYKLKTFQQTLRKFSVAALNRMPTEAENQRAETEAGFDSVVRKMMTEEAFGEWIKTTYNDLLLTNKYTKAWRQSAGRTKDPANNRIDLIQDRYYVYGDDFTGLANEGIMPENLYYDSRCMVGLKNWSIQQEPLELVKYVAMNDRPVEEIITGNYRMMNYYLQRFIYYGRSLDLGPFKEDDFRKKAYSLETFDMTMCQGFRYMNRGIEENSRWYYDHKHFLPAKMGRPITGAFVSRDRVGLHHDINGEIPLAGVLTSELFLHRYPTNDSNKNRLRAAMVFKYFLDEDIGASQVDDLESGDYDNPILQNPSCTHCHDRLDPVASAFANWHDDGKYYTYIDDFFNDNKGNYHHQQKIWNQVKLVRHDENLVKTPGYGDFRVAPEDYSRSLQLVAAEIAKDTRKYRGAVIRTLYNGLLGKYDNPPYFRAMYDAFENAGVDTSNMRELVLALIKHKDYRIDSVEVAGEDINDGEVRSVRLVTAESMESKIKAVTNRYWPLMRFNSSVRVLFGGIDSDGYTERFTQVSGVSEALSENMAWSMACIGVANDFRKDVNKRLLFPFVEMTDEPVSEASIARIKENLIHLHSWVLQEDLSLEDSELEITYQLFKRAYDTYKGSEDSSLRGECQIGEQDPEYPAERGAVTVKVPWDKQIKSDPHYTIKSWMAVMQYMMLDAKFLHE